MPQAQWAINAAFTEAGILSEFASNTLTSQICVSVKRPLKPGIPVNRMPFSAFQYVSDAGSSETPVPWKSWGGGGNIPSAIFVFG